MTENGSGLTLGWSGTPQSNMACLVMMSKVFMWLESMMCLIMMMIVECFDGDIYNHD